MLRLAALLLFCVPGAVFAETAERMLSACKAVSEAKMLDGDRIAIPQNIDSGMCWGAFSVISSVMDVASDPPNSRLFFGVCLTKGVSRSQEVRIFVDYATRNPQRLNEDFLFVARDALKAAFPCKA